MGLNPRERIDRVTKDLCAYLKLGIEQAGHPIAIVERGEGNPETNRINARSIRKVIVNAGKKLKFVLNSREIAEIQQNLSDAAEAADTEFDVCLRVAPIEKGVEIDVGDKSQTRIRLTPGKVDIINSGSEALFYRPAVLKPFVMPADTGDLGLLFQYLNFEKDYAWLLLAWMCLVISTPRSDHASYPILVLVAEQGASKTTTCKFIRSILDPSDLGVQGFPSDRKDMVLASNNAHILIYDNLRYLSKKWSDILCIGSTGGNDPTRKLYTDGELVNHRFLVPLILNGIHDFVEEPDLAQRCIRLELKSIPENKRRDQKELSEAFYADLPSIFRGLLDLTAKILEKLPTAIVTYPERMLSYVQYLAATEEVLKMDSGKLQSIYSKILNDTQRDSAFENPLASVIYELMTSGSKHKWSGTPSELLSFILDSIGRYDSRQRLLPNNPISLSKRLKALQAPLRKLQIEVVFTRGNERKITITNLEVF